MFVETWLTPAISDLEVLDDRYVVFRNDRNSGNSVKKSGGGVMIAVKSCLAPSVLSITANIEELWVSVQLVNKRYIFCAVYFPPDSNIDAYSIHVQNVKKKCI